MEQPVGTNLTPYLDFGGGYYPNHAIYYYPTQAVSPGSPGVLPVVTTATNNVSIIWIILILIVLIIIFKKINYKFNILLCIFLSQSRFEEMLKTSLDFLSNFHSSR